MTERHLKSLLMVLPGVVMACALCLLPWWPVIIESIRNTLGAWS